MISEAEALMLLTMMISGPAYRTRSSPVLVNIRPCLSLILPEQSGLPLWKTRHIHYVVEAAPSIVSQIQYDAIDIIGLSTFISLATSTVAQLLPSSFQMRE